MTTSLLELVYVKPDDTFVVKARRPTPEQAQKITELATRESKRKKLTCNFKNNPFNGDGTNVWTPPHALEHLILEGDQDGFTHLIEEQFPGDNTPEAHFLIEIWHRKKPLGREEITAAIDQINSL